MTAERQSNSKAQRAEIELGPLRFRISILIYASIVSLAALAVYDEPDSPLTWGTGLSLLLVVVGPVAALAIAHLFAEVAHEQLLLGRTPGWSDVRPLVALNLQFLLVGIPVIIWLPIAAALGLDANDSSLILMLFKSAALFVLGGVIAQRSSTSGVLRVVITLVYGTLGLLIVLTELAVGH